MLEAGILNDRSSERRNRILQLIKNLILIIYLLIIFEGALRKWLLPALSGPLFFIKDPLVILIYLLAFKYKILPKSKVYKVTIIISGLFFFAGILQMILNSLNPLVILLGFRNYFLLFPLTFFIAEHFTKNDLIRFARISCWIAIPTMFLVVAQYHSSPDAYINKNVGEGESTRIFTVVNGIVRTSGFFSFTTGHSQYVLYFIGFLFFNFFLSSREKFLSSLWYLIMLIVAVILVVYAGSRGVVANILILSFFILSASMLSINQKSSFRVLGLFFFGVIIVYFLINTFFDENLKVLSERFETASKQENTLYRFFSQYIEVFRSLGSNEVPIWGKGIGTGSNAGAFFMRGARMFITAEAEWLSIMAEVGPILGFTFILYRVWLSGSTLYRAFVVFRMKGLVIPVIFSSMVFMSFFGGQMTKQGTEFYFAWFFMGLALAANRIYAQEENIPIANNGVSLIREEIKYINVRRL